MTDYIEVVKEAWSSLKSGPKDKGFDPKSETDVQWFFCHCILEKLGTAQPIRTEVPTKIGVIDIVVARTVFIEVKYIIKTGRRTPKAWQSRERNLMKDISKLGKLTEKNPNIKGVLAVFSGYYDEEKDESWYKDMEENCKKSGVIMLRAWKKLG